MKDETIELDEFPGVFITRSGRAFQEINGVLEEIPRRKNERMKCMISFKIDGKVKRRELVILMLEKFGGEKLGDPRHYHIIHKDGNCSNCALDNLRLIHRKGEAE